MTRPQEPAGRETAYDLVQQQAEDEGLWFIARYCSESYLQQALRKLHAAVEEDSMSEQKPRPDNGQILKTLDLLLDDLVCGDRELHTREEVREAIHAHVGHYLTARDSQEEEMTAHVSGTMLERLRRGNNP